MLELLTLGTDLNLAALLAGLDVGAVSDQLALFCKRLNLDDRAGARNLSTDSLKYGNVF
jgi:hypothetical protein